MEWTFLRQVPLPTTTSQRYNVICMFYLLCMLFLYFCLHIFISSKYAIFFIFPCMFFQSFTRLAELVLQANKKDLDLLGGSMNDEFNLAILEEQEGLCNVSDDTRKSCWCWGQEVTWLLFQLISIFKLHFHFEYHFAKLNGIVEQCLMPLMAYFLLILINIIYYSLFIL